ncbi:MAG: hypothetical protein R2738_04395 [Bacteroides graminisolvens]
MNGRARVQMIGKPIFYVECDRSFVCHYSEGEHWLVYGSWHSDLLLFNLMQKLVNHWNELGKPWSINGDHSSYGDLIARRVDMEGGRLLKLPELFIILKQVIIICLWHMMNCP